MRAATTRWTGRLGRAAIAGLVTVVSVTLGAAPPAAEAGPVAPSTVVGRIPMDDGVSLRFSARLPSSGGRAPVAMIYTPYGGGSLPSLIGNDPLVAGRLLARGYAVAIVSVRGTGCSGGVFDPMSKRQAEDGAAAVEWLARQPWSDGRVGTFGLSFPAMVQFGLAAEHPPHLRAIAPAQFAADLYRDTGFPGGILNGGFAALWTGALQPGTTTAGALGDFAAGDLSCPVRVPARQLANALALTSLLNDASFDSPVLQARDPASSMAAVAVPALGCLTWQDDMVGSRGLDDFEERMRPGTTWFVGANGYHGMCDDDWYVDRLVQFLDHFVRGVDNGFERSPHVVLVHEARPTARRLPPLNGWLPGTLPTVGSVPSWTSTFSSWPTVEAHRFELGSGGVLSREGVAAGHDSYASPASTSGTEDGSIMGGLDAVWKLPRVAGGELVYTSAPLTKDMEVFGPASADLWLASTASDTDVQVTLSEVRPDGQDVYVGRGWLRASHRRLDASRSSAVRPFQTHRPEDVAPLVPGRAALLRIEVFPMDHVLRRGSELRLTVDAPLAPTGSFTLTANPFPATNTVLYGGLRASSLVVGAIPTGPVPRALPRCDSVISEPCRPEG